MVLTLLTALAAVQAITLIGLGYALFRVVRVNGASIQSHADLALIGTVEELLVELEEMTTQAFEELGRQRLQLEALLKDTDDTEDEIAARRSRATRGRARRTDTAMATAGSSAQRRDRAVELRDAGYQERDIARELRTSVDEVRLLLATAARQREGA